MQSWIMDRESGQFMLYPDYEQKMNEDRRIAMYNAYKEADE